MEPPVGAAWYPTAGRTMSRATARPAPRRPVLERQGSVRAGDVADQGCRPTTHRPALRRRAGVRTWRRCPPTPSRSTRSTRRSAPTRTRSTPACASVEPVHVSPLGFVVLTRYDDVARTLRGNEFSRDVEANAAENRGPGPARCAASGCASGARRATAAKNILNLDPPDHTRLRRLVSLAFTPSAIERLRPRDRGARRRHPRPGRRAGLDGARRRARLPRAVPGHLRPARHADRARGRDPRLVAGADRGARADRRRGDDGGRRRRRRRCSASTSTRSSPTAAGTSATTCCRSCCVVEEAGDRLTPAELKSFVVLLYVAGHETTVNLIGNGAARPAAPSRRAAPLARRPGARRHGRRRAAALRRPGPADGPDPDAGRALRRRRGRARARP